MKYTSQLKVILERSSMYYIKNHIDKYTNKITSVTKQWRKWVKQQLSVAYVKGTRNTSLYPQLRTGALRNSLVSRKVVVKRFTKLNNGRAKAEIIVPVTYTKLKDDYGEKLNSSTRFYDKTFFGWKDRVQEELERRIKGRT